jgi:hypothetical protein
MQANTAIRLATGDHVVHFYEDDDDLIAVVVRYLGSALGRHEAAVVVATPAHAERFRQGFARSGVDVDGADAAGRLIILDAAAALAALAPAGATDAAAFDDIMTSTLRRARAAGTRVCVYGEMAALSIDRGRPECALALEECWNDLGQREGFSLLCAYPTTADPGLGGDRAEAYARICRVHSDVVADQPQLDDAEYSCAFARGPHAPWQARRFVTDVLRRWRLDELVDPARLIVTELATNAVVHARSGFTVSLNHEGPVVRIAVGDGAASVPQRAPGGACGSRGRGIPIIEAMASRWGHLALDRGKLVWAELAGAPVLTPTASR